jgi:hypothetical protein
LADTETWRTFFNFGVLIDKSTEGFAMRAFTYFFAISLIVLSPLTHAQLFGPTPYLKPADVPPGFSDGAVNLEDFEDQRISTDLAIRGNIPVTIVQPSNVTDSVDYDDRLLDGLGRAGHTLQSSGLVRIDFKTRPQSAGVVWTDGGGAVSFEAFALDGSSLGISGPHLLADGNATGGTAEDRFFGVRNSNGIKAIEIRATGGIEIDHVQWSVNFNAGSNNMASFALPNPGFVRAATIVDLERFSDGSFLIAGDISSIDGVTRTGLAKLTPLGALDPSFDQSSIPASVFLTTAIDSAGKVYVTDGARLIRLNADGTLDSGFARINFSPTFARALTVLPDGILVGGSFTSVFRNSAADAVTRNGLAKLDVNGNLSEFNVSANGNVGVLKTLAGGKVLAGGLSTYNGISVRSPIRIVLSTGQLDQNILPTAAGSEMTQIMFYHQGNIYGRHLQNANSRVARMPENGGALDASWLVRVRSGVVSSMCLLADRVALSSDSGFEGIGTGFSISFATVPLQDVLFRDGWE